MEQKVDPLGVLRNKKSNILFLNNLQAIPFLFTKSSVKQKPIKIITKQKSIIISQT